MMENPRTLPPTRTHKALAALGIVGLLLVAAALGYERHGYELREEYRRRSGVLSQSLAEAMEKTRALQSRSVRRARTSSLGDTLYLEVPGPAQRVEEVALYVDKSIGGLRMRDQQGDAEILAVEVDLLRVEVLTTMDGQDALLVELTAFWRTGAGPDLRRSICRYFEDREQITG